MSHLVLILFLFALGACVGSFLNVVVWRLPRGQSLITPPSSCPKCKNPLKWYDNIPVFGWIKLGGKCRFCKQPISIRYPIVEAVTGLLFVYYYANFFIAQIGPCAPRPLMIPHETLGTLKMAPMPLFFLNDWPIYLLYMAMIAGLLAASMIDWELFIIPIEIPWIIAALGILVHALIDKPSLPGALMTTPAAAAMAAGGAIGLILSIMFLRWGFIPLSFPEDEPMQDKDAAKLASSLVEKRDGEAEPEPRDYTSREIRAEMRKEMMFLLPPMLLAALAWYLMSNAPWWHAAMKHDWVNGMMGAILGALVGGFVIWIVRIIGTYGFGRLAMGLGDVHLMFGIGAVIGAAAVTVTFFIAPFFAILVAIYRLIFRKGREIPFGPYLSMAAATMLIFSCPILAYVRPGMMGLGLLAQDLIFRGHVEPL